MAGVPGGLGYVAKEAAYGAIGSAAGGALLAVAMVGSALFVVAAAVTGWGPFVSRRVAPPQGAHEVAPALWGPPLVLATCGIAMGVAPLAVDALLAPTAAALAGGPTEPLALFHGWGTAVLSLATLAAGAAVVRQRPRIRAALGASVARGSRDGFGFFLRALSAVAARHTAVLQTGSLRRYLVVTFAVAGAALAVGFARGVDASALRVEAPALPEAALGSVAIIAAVAAVRARSRISAITALGAVGYSVGLTFLLFGAPDLAMTQIAVETVTVMVFLLAFRHLPRLARLSTIGSRTRDAALASAVGVAMALLVLAANAVEDGAPISAYHVERSVPDAHGRNVVNTILVDFRGLDTLGEVTVLAIAGAGVVALLKLRPRRTAA
jgi:multicomponent Na+:H+ antiporter subunit A